MKFAGRTGASGAPHLQQWQKQLVEPPLLHEADGSLACAAHLIQQHQHRDLIWSHPVLDAEHVGMHYAIGHHGVEVEAFVDTGHGVPDSCHHTPEFRLKHTTARPEPQPARAVSQGTGYFALAVCRRPIREAILKPQPIIMLQRAGGRGQRRCTYKLSPYRNSCGRRAGSWATLN